LGNLNNPSINRWGLNLFWYKLWYSDKNYPLTLQLIKLIENFIYIYLMYGVLFRTSPHSSNRWVADNLQKFELQKHNEKYYRKIRNIINEYGVSDGFAVLRARVKNLYLTRMWIMRYQNWIIVNFYYFIPIKNSSNTSNNAFKNLILYQKNKKNSYLYLKHAKLLLLQLIKNNSFTGNF